MKASSKNKKVKEIPKTMTEAIQDCIKEGVSKQDAKLALSKSFPDKTSDSIRAMVNKQYSLAETTVPVSPAKVTKTKKKEPTKPAVKTPQVSDTEEEPEPSEPAVVDGVSDTAS